MKQNKFLIALYSALIVLGILLIVSLSRYDVKTSGNYVIKVDKLSGTVEYYRLLGETYKKLNLVKEDTIMSKKITELGKLYIFHANLISENYDTPKFDEFLDDLRKNKNIEFMFENLKNDRWNLPEFNIFQSTIQKGIAEKDSARKPFIYIVDILEK